MAPLWQVIGGQFVPVLSAERASRCGRPAPPVATAVGEVLGRQCHNGPVSNLDPRIASLLKRDPDGLVPAIVQDADAGIVLMLAWMDDEALARTLASGRATYWSRSRQEYWVKGETSGHTQAVREVRLDCDGDAVLLRVDQVGPACHTGAVSCFDAAVLQADRQ